MTETGVPVTVLDKVLRDGVTEIELRIRSNGSFDVYWDREPGPSSSGFSTTGPERLTEPVADGITHVISVQARHGWTTVGLPPVEAARIREAKRLRLPQETPAVRSAGDEQIDTSARRIARATNALRRPGDDASEAARCFGEAVLAYLTGHWQAPAEWLVLAEAHARNALISDGYERGHAEQIMADNPDGIGDEPAVPEGTPDSSGRAPSD
jgi:hypothetical protein